MASSESQVLLAGSVPDTQHLQQPSPAEDDFFEDEHGVVAVYDFDYELIMEFQQKLQWAQFLLTPPMWTTVLCCSPCFLNQNIEWRTQAKHVALTVDGIRYVKDKHPTMCGLSCTDSGKVSKTVPYDKITDCDVEEPAGTACLCCIDNVLSSVNVDTASSGAKDGMGSHELVLQGLSHPLEFKQAVWKMKRSGHTVSSDAPGAAGQPQLASVPAQASMTNQLLVEIRDELKQLNANLSGKAPRP